MESVPACIWPAPLSVTPGQTRPAPLTHSPPVFPHGSARTHTRHSLTQSHTHSEDTEWRRKGARAACPPRTPLTTPGKKNFFLFFKFPLSQLFSFTLETNLLFCEGALARYTHTTHTHTPLHWEPSCKTRDDTLLDTRLYLHDHTFHTSITTLSLLWKLMNIKRTDWSFNEYVNIDIFCFFPQQNVHRWTQLANNTR